MDVVFTCRHRGRACPLLARSVLTVAFYFDRASLLCVYSNCAWGIHCTSSRLLWRAVLVVQNTCFSFRETNPLILTSYPCFAPHLQHLLQLCMHRRRCRRQRAWSQHPPRRAPRPHPRQHPVMGHPSVACSSWSARSQDCCWYFWDTASSRSPSLSRDLLFLPIFSSSSPQVGFLCSW